MSVLRHAGILATGAALGLLPELAFAQAAAFNEATTFSMYVTVFWRYASHIIFTLSTLTIITGGVVYVASAGDDTRVGAAKEIIRGAVISIILVIVSGSAIDMLVEKPGAGANVRDRDAAFLMLNNTSSMFIGLAGAFTLVMLIYNAIRYITANGDEEKIGTARRGMTYSVIGLVICVSAYVIVRNVISIF